MLNKPDQKEIKQKRKKLKEKGKYHNAEKWQIAFFALNNTATNTAFVLIMYYAFFTQNVLGLSAAIVGGIATAMRMFDGFTDPVIGFILDKTDTKFGKYRPFMLAGNIILVVMIIALFNVPPEWSAQTKYIVTALLYGLAIIGYTFQTSCTKGAQAALTNDPAQRPLFTFFDAIYNTLLFAGATWFIMTYMAPKYAQNVNDPALWSTVSVIFMAASFVMTVLAIIGIWSKDRTEYFGLAENAVEIKFKDAWEVLKNNRPLQMLIVAASTDKLALTARRAGFVYFFSNILYNTALQGTFSVWVMAPAILVTYLGVKYAEKVGLKNAFVKLTWMGTALIVVLLVITPMLAEGELTTGVLILLVVLGAQYSVSQLAGNIVIPMIADCTDYESCRSGRFMSGFIGTIFSFVDKMISSLGTVIIGFSIALAGYGGQKIPPNSPVSQSLEIAILFIVFGLPLIGHVASLIAMKFYPLDAEKMAEIQDEIEEKKSVSSPA
ncbi:Na+/melibiose symporter-like transporter [Halanaerobium saccharolyticum]|uniref:Na+/melibiose symporter-like transporter n=1 Tax=Halanaerobium saccharolyticum TaxID=43595 RepID=A0A4R6LYS2_9FIRM|nr:MFS transporter [Halanaerobium saccharolyticum]TDO93943.1 Na+/melibiose symporter-like transporter [Halanaerobium saccharolyticum]